MKTENLNSDQADVMGCKKGAAVIDEIMRNHKFGTMDNDCEHYIEKLYNENGDYKADYCTKCKGLY